MRPPDWFNADLDSLRKGAAGGDPDAQWALGKRLLNGTGIERDPRRALRWLARSVRGFPHYGIRVAEWFRDGEQGLPKSSQRELAWYRRAARHGNSEAMFAIAWMRMSRGDPRRQFPAASRWCRRAIRLGDGQAALHLGRWTWLIKHDYAAARRWLRVALVLPTDEAGVYLEWLECSARWRRLVESRPIGEIARGAERGDRDAAFQWGIARLYGFAAVQDSESGEAWLTKAAEAGHVEAQLALGFTAEARVRRRGNVEDALRWFQRAARTGDPTANYCAAMSLINYGGSRVEYRRAVRHLHRAASGCRFAAHELAEAYGTTWGVRTNREEAHQWGMEAARLRDPRGQYSTGLSFRDGYASARKNSMKAAMWFRRAADQGHPEAQLEIGVFLHQGRGVRRSDRECVKWYRRAARLGHPSAMLNLFLCYRKGDGVGKNLSQAFRWLQRAAALGNIRAWTRLGDAHYFAQGVRRDYAAAARWYRKAAETSTERKTGAWVRDHEIDHAQKMWGHCLHDGTGVEKDFAEAATWFRRAASFGNAGAMLNLGQCYRCGDCRIEGRGVPKSRRAALSWFRKAAALGDAEARAELRKMTGREGRQAQGSTGKGGGARI